jgi:hypothetical protein
VRSLDFARDVTTNQLLDLTSAALDGGSSIIYFILNFAVFGEFSLLESTHLCSYIIRGASGNAVSFPTWWGNPDPTVLSVGE